jgi:hypothetical protein
LGYRDSQIIRVQEALVICEDQHCPFLEVPRGAADADTLTVGTPQFRRVETHPLGIVYEEDSPVCPGVNQKGDIAAHAEAWQNEPPFEIGSAACVAKPAAQQRLRGS